MTMIQFVFQQFILTIEGPIRGFCYNLMLTPKKPQQSAWIRILPFWGVYILTTSMSWFSGVWVSSFVSLAVSSTLCQIVLQYFYKEKLQTTIFAYLTLFSMQAIADILVSSVYILAQGHITNNYMQDQMISIFITLMAVSSLLEFLASWIWRRRKGIQTRGMFVVITLMVVIFLQMIFLAAGILFFQGEYFLSFLQASSISVGVLVLQLMVCFYFQQKQQKQNRLEWENLKRLKQSQEEFFRSLEKLEQKTSFIRHDHINVLVAVCQLLEQSESAEAAEVLGSYLGRIESSVDPEEENSGPSLYESAPVYFPAVHHDH